MEKIHIFGCNKNYIYFNIFFMLYYVYKIYIKNIFIKNISPPPLSKKFCQNFKI